MIYHFQLRSTMPVKITIIMIIIIIIDIYLELADHNNMN